VRQALVVVGFALLTAALGCAGGRRLEDRTTSPELPASALEVVANLDSPPGNIAVSSSGRIFFTFHPDGEPAFSVAELVGGRPVPYPDEAFQHPRNGAPYFQSPLSVRIDAKDRLWVLDHANYGRGQPRLLAFDLATNRLVEQYDFPSSVAGLLSMLNDFQIDPRAQWIYIADASPIRRTPAIVVYDIEQRASRRMLERHASVMPADFVIQAPGRDMILFGVYRLAIGIDSIALDKQGESLYYGPVNGDRLYRVPAAALRDPSLPGQDLAAKVEDYSAKTLSDGITMDLAGNVYLSDMEQSAILAVGGDRKLRTLLKDPRLRWPDGFSFGPDGWLYVTCSSLQYVVFKSKATIDAHAPYQIFRFKPGENGVPGQ
jgi:sugar lactone lactonase YvrE